MSEDPKPKVIVRKGMKKDGTFSRSHLKRLRTSAPLEDADYLHKLDGPTFRLRRDFSLQYYGGKDLVKAWSLFKTTEEHREVDQAHRAQARDVYSPYLPKKEMSPFHQRNSFVRATRVRFDDPVAPVVANLNGVWRQINRDPEVTDAERSRFAKSADRYLSEIKRWLGKRKRRSAKDINAVKNISKS